MRIKRGEIEGSLADYFQNLIIRGFLLVLLALPYRIRVPFMGWIASALIAPIAGWRKRVRDNLAHVFPDMPKVEVERLARAVPNNTGRTLIEIYSGEDFKSRMKNAPLRGPGVEALKKARAEERPVVIVTGHFGNYDAPRAALFDQGFELGSLYRPMKNPFFNAHYVKAISTIGEPMFARGRKGNGQMLRYLKSGGMIGILIDIYVQKAPILSYFGKPAKTALTAADIALKYDALVVPMYGIRQDDGLSFEIFIDEPIAEGDPSEMTQALNDSLEKIARQHMDQWFWIHKRWKPELLAKEI